MKAIDFACHLLVHLARDKHPFPTQQILLAVAAGLDRAPDISHFTGLSTNNCAGVLRSLTHKGLVTRCAGSQATYQLAAEGKKLVREYFSFLPNTHS